MKFSSLQEISASERTTCLLDQPSVAKVSKINDCIPKTFEQAFDSVLRVVIVCGNKCNTSRAVDDRFRFQVGNDHGVQCLNHSGSRGKRRNELASGQVSNIGECEFSSLTVKRIGPIDQDLICPLGKTCKCFGHVVPGNSKKYHFASRRLFLGGCRRSWSKLIDNFSEAVGTAAVAKHNLVARLQCPFCERLCESSCSNGSDFHTRSFLIWAFQ